MLGLARSKTKDVNVTLRIFVFDFVFLFSGAHIADCCFDRDFYLLLPPWTVL